MPLEGKCEKKERKPGDLTGKITCTLETLTPLFIPKDIEESVDFFHYDDDKTPVIPGSELRGTIRSVFEAAFNGCLSQVNTEYFHRRSKEIKKPGILRNTKDGWQLQKCEKKKIPSKFASKEGKVLFYKPNFKTESLEFTVENKEGQKNWKKGFVHIGEKGPKGVSKSIFCPIEEIIAIQQAEINRLEQILLLYQSNNQKNKKHSGYSEYTKLFKKVKSQESSQYSDLVLPVYYYEYEGVVSYLAPASISQEIFTNTLHDILDAQGNYSPCKCSKIVCPVCHVFGFVSKTDARSSRVRFSDAIIIKNPPSYEKIVRLPALGEPKPGAVEFYTEVPEKIQRKYWTYDYSEVDERYQENGCEKLRKKRIPIESDEIKIRGRKFYWHHKIASDLLKPISINEKVPEMEYNIKPLKEGNKFTFTVYFEQLAKEELNQLCWALDFGNLESHAHKIGRAKPLGLGSVQITIDEIILRTIDKESGQWQLNTCQRHLYMVELNKEMKILMNIMQHPMVFQKDVQYPKVYSTKSGVNNTASHKWFTKNKKSNCFDKVLPKIEEELNPKKAEKWLNAKKL